METVHLAKDKKSVVTWARTWCSKMKAVSAWFPPSNAPGPVVDTHLRSGRCCRITNGSISSAPLCCRRKGSEFSCALGSTSAVSLAGRSWPFCRGCFDTCQGRSCWYGTTTPRTSARQSRHSSLVIRGCMSTTFRVTLQNSIQWRACGASLPSGLPVQRLDPCVNCQPFFEAGCIAHDDHNDDCVLAFMPPSCQVRPSCSGHGLFKYQ